MMISAISAARLNFDGDARVSIQGVDPPAPVTAGFYVEDAKIADALHRPLPPTLADLVDVAMAVYLADRSVRRRLHALDAHELGWNRELTLRLPVRLLERWREKEVTDALRQCLEFATDDAWDFRFVARDRPPRSSECQTFLFSTELARPARIALFSGGLDSLAGVAADVARERSGSLVLYAGSTNPRLTAILEDLDRDIREATSGRARTLVVPLGLRQSASRYNSCERSQRSRGFLHASLGVVVAALAERDRVAVYENGIGAINLPYSPAQLGTHSTRSAHPVALSRLSRLVSLVTGGAITVELPHLFSTKAELCRHLADSTLRASIKRTVTCDSFPLRQKGPEQCGVCTSCLLRRQSLWAAGLEREDPGELYLYDVVNPPGNLADKRWHPLRDMLSQVDTFRRALAATRPWTALAGQYPILNTIASSLNEDGITRGIAEAQNELMDLFERYCAEWDRFPARPPGWQFGMSDPRDDWRFRHAC